MTISRANLPESFRMRSPVLVTGATGYIAGWIIKKLLEEGVIVHATVRDPTNEKKLEHLKKLDMENPGQLKLFKADLLEAGSFAEAMQGCTAVFHIASPFTTRFVDVQKDLVDPAFLGTKNVLETVNKTATVGRVVVTSSIVAIYGDNKDIELAPNKILTERQWNTTSTLEHNPYRYSKTLAEKEAWRIHDAQSRWKLVALNPSLVFGPSLAQTGSESFTLMLQYGDGTMMTGCPKLGFGVVDVRDVAEAHIRAAFSDDAKGRYLISGGNTSVLEVSKALQSQFEGFPLPKFEHPKAFAWVIGPLVTKRLTRKFVALNVGFPFKADNSKSVIELKLEYRPLHETVQEFFQELVDNKRLKPK